MKFRFLIFFFILLPSYGISESYEIEKLFTERGITGTIVISALHSEKTFIYNTPRANQRFSTASTFKILNTLIALEEKVLSGKDDVIKWDGTIYDFPGWNQDQTLENAFKVSCVWFYQELAKRIGVKKYQYYQQMSDYGQLSDNFNGETFWLDGSLQISAMEQVDFLKKIYHRTLPFSESSYEILKDIMTIEKTSEYTLRAKSGWAARMDPQIGWFVGYFETTNNLWFFATNIDINDIKDLPMRKKITIEALKSQKIIK